MRDQGESDAGSSGDSGPIERVDVDRGPVIPDFDAFADQLRRIHAHAAEDLSGRVADYIPQLGSVPPERHGLAVCTVDGRRLSLGDADVPFSLQSCSKPVNYCLALEEHGPERVHSHVGWEPSGRPFNELYLDRDGRPHNPMLNAGGIISCSLVRAQDSPAERLEAVVDIWARMSGGRRPGFSQAVYESEKATADRNFALGHMMRERGAFPADTDLLETLDFYFRCCSLEVTADDMSVAAATLANGGVCPTTCERVLHPDTVQKCLSLMTSCGMYDFSGEWGFKVGLPAKSGVSGCVFVVVPNVLGLCVWSPRLDRVGNSVRGVRFCQELVRTFNFHVYDNLDGALHDKIDPRRPRP